MSSFRAHSMAGRVVLVHDMDEQTIISEFDVEQASTLLNQLETALAEVLEGIAKRPATPAPEVIA
ncbi:hypothetical protein ACE7GA_22540 [Roseomonas sp. CCTCC AB2023176]|uniref:hypothetical protein n=1 Tax=Roseomonas sp. CCTCC AB2023176 TaxID=3342640 RepID=UPI0035E10046